LIAKALQDYRPDLRKAVNTLQSDALPDGVSNPPDGDAGYPPVPAKPTVVGGMALAGDIGGTAAEPLVVAVNAGLQNMFVASGDSPSYPLRVDSEIISVVQRVQPQSPNDGSNYWEAHIATGDIELATWNSTALVDDAWNTVTTTSFNRTELDADIDGSIIVWFTAVGAPGELLFETPIVKLRES
jgi:hypothetical protein